MILAALVRIERKDDVWIVPSQTTASKRYEVTLAGEGSCSCPDHDAGYTCKHIRAVRIVLKRELGMDGTITETTEMTFTQKKVYKQNWPAYNEAQITEKHRLQVLLHDLCRGLKDVPHPGKGRKPTPVADAVFKIYIGFSSRRYGGDLLDCHTKGYLSKPMHPNKVNCHLENGELTPIFKNLVVQSSLPLRAQNFTVQEVAADKKLSEWIRDRLRRLSREELEKFQRPVPFLSSPFS